MQDSYTDLAERDESFDLETRMFETEDLDARDFDWEDDLVAREESTTPTETTPTPASPGTGAPVTSLASGSRKVRFYGDDLWKISSLFNSTATTRGSTTAFVMEDTAREGAGVTASTAYVPRVKDIFCSYY